MRRPAGQPGPVQRASGLLVLRDLLGRNAERGQQPTEGLLLTHRRRVWVTAQIEVERALGKVAGDRVRELHGQRRLYDTWRSSVAGFECLWADMTNQLVHRWRGLRDMRDPPTTEAS